MDPMGYFLNLGGSGEFNLCPEMHHPKTDVSGLKFDIFAWSIDICNDI